MNAVKELVRLVDDLAGHWTEPVLEVLQATGMRRLTVDIELAVWRTLRRRLVAELRQERLRYSTLVPLGTLMENVLGRTAQQIRRRYDPLGASREMESWMVQWGRGRIASALERRLYAEIAQNPALGRSLKPLSRTDYLPHLRTRTMPA